MKHAEYTADWHVIAATLQGESALTRRRKQLIHRMHEGFVIKPGPMYAGGGKHDRVEFAGLQLPKTGIDVAAQR